jgi:hypothetical protein
MRLTFVVSNLACGGVQRVTAWLSGALARRGHQVTVITFASDASDFFHLPQDVSRVALGITASRPTPLWRLPAVTASRLARIRRAVQSSAPDVVISRAAPVNVPTSMATRRRSATPRRRGPGANGCGTGCGGSVIQPHSRW